MIHLAFSYIRGYKKNTILSIAGIAFSVMLMFSLLQMGEMMLSQFRHMVGDYATMDFKVYDFEMEKLDEIYSYLKDNYKEYTLCKDISYGTAFMDDGMTTILIDGMDGDWMELFQLKLLEGRLPEQKGEICIGEGYCKAVGKKPEEIIGTDLTLMVHDDEGMEHELTWKVTAVISDVGIPGSYHMMITTCETAVSNIENNSFQYDKKYNQILLLRDRYSNSTEENVNLQIDLQDRFGDKYFYKNHIQNDETRGELFSNEESTYHNLVTVFSCVALLVAFALVVFVYNTVSICITEKIRQYGMMRCIGINRTGLLRLVANETLFYTVCGILTGVVFGIGLNRLVAGRMVMYMANITLEEYNPGIYSYFVTPLLTLLSVALAFLVAFWKIRKLEPVEMMRFVETKYVGGKVEKKTKDGKLLQEMAGRNIKRNRTRSGTLLFTLTLSGTILMVLLNIAGLVDIHAADKWHLADYELASNVILEEEYIPAEKVRQLEQMDAVDAVYWQRWERNMTCKPDQPHDMMLMVYSDNLYDALLQLYGIKGKDVKRDELAFVFCDKDWYSCSNVDIFFGEKGKEKYMTIPVAGVYSGDEKLLGDALPNAGDDAFLIVNQKMAQKIYDVFGNKKFLEEYTGIMVSGKELTEEKLRELFGQEVSVANFKELMENSDTQLLGMGMLAIYILLVVMVLGVLIINNIIKTNIVTREKEIGMMRSIGAEDVLVKKLLGKEIMELTVRAVIIACMIAFPITAYLSIMMHDRLKITIIGYLIGAMIVLGGCYFLTQRAVKKNLAGKNISEMLHCD